MNLTAVLNKFGGKYDCKDLIDSGEFKIINDEGDTAAEITDVFCCDLLSVAMAHAPGGSAWVTVMPI